MVSGGRYVQLNRTLGKTAAQQHTEHQPDGCFNCKVSEGCSCRPVCCMLPTDPRNRQCCQPIPGTDNAAPARLAVRFSSTSDFVHALRVLMKAPWSQPVDVSGPFLNSAYASAARVRIRVLPICGYGTRAHCYLCSSVFV